MRRMRRLIAALILILFANAEAVACTLWAAVGPSVAGGGALIVKNRDWPEEGESATTVTPEEGCRYFAVLAHVTSKKTGRKFTRTVAGLNEAGLAVVSASASSIPEKQRMADKNNGKLMRQLLSGARSVDEALDPARFPPSLFQGPRFLLLADARETAWVEIGLGGKFSVRRVKSGVLTHTNHFLAPDMQDFNIRVGKSSALRFERIGTLLRAGLKPYTLDRFTAFARDAAAGPDNSIFRTGSKPAGTRTLSVFAVSLPPQGPPEIRLWMKESGANDFTTLRATDLFPPRANN